MGRADDVTAIILAGGKSRRFGGNKAFAPFRGRPMIHWVYAAVEPLAAAVLLSTKASAPGAAPVAVESHPFNEPPIAFNEPPLSVNDPLLSINDPPLSAIITVADRIRGAGPLGGLHAGMSRAETAWVLAVACDMPMISTGALERLLSQRGEGVDAVVARDSSGRLQPLCACYRTTLLPQISELLEAGRFAMMGLLDALDTVRVVDLPDRVLKNVNRRVDLAG